MFALEGNLGCEKDVVLRCHYSSPAGVGKSSSRLHDMLADMTTKPWPPEAQRRTHSSSPLSSPCERTKHRRRDDASTSNKDIIPKSASRSRRVAGSHQWCWHKIHRYSVFLVFVVLVCMDFRLCAGSDSEESFPSRPFLPSTEGSGESEDPLASLSKVFGIKRIPGKIFKRTPPQYMTDLFKEVADSSGLTKASGPYNANTVRSFPDRDTMQQAHYFYNVSHLPKQSDEERMLEAEFHIFKMKPRPTRSVHTQPPSHHVQLKIYQVLDKSKMHSPEGLRLLDTRRISAHKHGWLTFRVTKAVEDWRVRPENNNGLLVVAQSQSGQNYTGSYIRFAQRNQHHDSKQPIVVVFTDDASSDRHPTYVSLDDQDYRRILDELNERERQAAEERERQLQRDQPTDTPGLNSSGSQSGFDRNFDFQQAVRMLNEQARAKSYKSQPQSKSTGGRQRRRRHAVSGSVGGKKKQKRGRQKRMYDIGNYRYRGRSCAKHKMYVDFEEIGWSGWIISPKGYDAFHCTGLCPFPLGQSQKPTNHATVQSIVHALRVGSKNLNTPCCVPNKLFSISLLYFDDDENVILKQYDDMVAASCGCH